MQNVIQRQASQALASAQPESLTIIGIRCPTKLCDARGSLMLVSETASRRNCHGLAVEHGVRQAAPYHGAQTPVPPTKVSKELVIRLCWAFLFSLEGQQKHHPDCKTGHSKSSSCSTLSHEADIAIQLSG
jgi:hypothetical protein